MLLDLLLRAKFPEEHRELVDLYTDDDRCDFNQFLVAFNSSPLAQLVPLKSAQYEELTTHWFNYYYQRRQIEPQSYYTWT